MDTLNNQSLGIFAILFTAGLTGVGFFVKHVMGQVTASIDELKFELRRTNERLDHRVDRIESRIDSMSFDIADMKPKVNALWEHFLTTNKKSL